MLITAILRRIETLSIRLKETKDDQQALQLRDELEVEEQVLISKLDDIQSDHVPLLSKTILDLFVIKLKTKLGKQRWHEIRSCLDLLIQLFNKNLTKENRNEKTLLELFRIVFDVLDLLNENELADLEISKIYEAVIFFRNLILMHLKQESDWELSLLCHNIIKHLDQFRKNLTKKIKSFSCALSIYIIEVENLKYIFIHDKNVVFEILRILEKKYFDYENISLGSLRAFSHVYANFISQKGFLNLDENDFSVAILLENKAEALLAKDAELFTLYSLITHYAYRAAINSLKECANLHNFEKLKPGINLLHGLLTRKSERNSRMRNKIGNDSIDLQAERSRCDSLWGFYTALVSGLRENQPFHEPRSRGRREDEHSRDRHRSRSRNHHRNRSRSRSRSQGRERNREYDVSLSRREDRYAHSSVAQASASAIPAHTSTAMMLERMSSPGAFQLSQSAFLESKEYSAVDQQAFRQLEEARHQSVLIQAQFLAQGDQRNVEDVQVNSKRMATLQSFIQLPPHAASPAIAAAAQEFLQTVTMSAAAAPVANGFIHPDRLPQMQLPAAMPAAEAPIQSGFIHQARLAQMQGPAAAPAAFFALPQSQPGVPRRQLQVVKKSDLPKKSKEMMIVVKRR